MLERESLKLRDTLRILALSLALQHPIMIFASSIGYAAPQLWKLMYVHSDTYLYAFMRTAYFNA